MGPRYGFRWIDVEFMAHIGEFDVWVETGVKKKHLYVVGPEHRKVRPDSPHYHDAFFVKENGLVISEPQDLHIELYEMCLLYQLCQEHGILKERV